MKRIVLAVIGLYLVTAVVSRLAESTGAWNRQCGRHDDCWCKKPGLTLFRWVTPRRAHHTWTAEEKQQFAETMTS